MHQQSLGTDGADRPASHRSTPAPTRPPPALIVVEGRYDIEFLKRISAILAADDQRLPNLCELEQHGRLIFLPAGGEFEIWLDRLAGLGCPEVYIFDRETPPITEQRQAWANRVNQREGCRAFITGQRSLENYLHPAAIRQVRGLNLTYTGEDDVAALAAETAFAAYAPGAWETLAPRARRRLRNLAKHWLNTKAVDCMTAERLAERDPAGEIPQWLVAIGEFASRQ